MSNKYTGEVDFKLGEKALKVVFDLRAVAKFQSTFGNDADVDQFSLEQLIKTLIIGLEKHHSDITEEEIYEANPPIENISDAIVAGFIYAKKGPEEGQKIIDEALKAADELKKKMAAGETK